MQRKVTYKPDKITNVQILACLQENYASSGMFPGQLIFPRISLPRIDVMQENQKESEIHILDERKEVTHNLTHT